MDSIHESPHGKKLSLRWFMCGLAVSAFIINSALFRQGPGPQRPSQTTPQTATALPREDEATKASRMAQANAAAEQARYAAKYLKSDIVRPSSGNVVAVSVCSETMKSDHAVAAALSDRLRLAGFATVSSPFTPEFLADGLFSHAFDGSTDIGKRLNLSQITDMVVLAKQDVQFSKDPSLQNVITAAMQLNIHMAPVSDLGDAQSWTLTASGSGFAEADARNMAEERLVKKIAQESKLDFRSFAANHSTK